MCVSLVVIHIYWNGDGLWTSEMDFKKGRGVTLISSPLTTEQNK